MARSTMNHIIAHLRLKVNDSEPTPLADDEYYAGDTIKLSNTYNDLDGTATDPTSPTITITDPQGTVKVDGETPTKEETGIYYHYYAPTAVAGWWLAEFGGTVDSEATVWPHRFLVLTDEKHTWTDDDLQVFLDLHRTRLNRVELKVDPDEQVFESGYTMLEGSVVTWSGVGSPDDVINIWDGAGAVATYKTPDDRFNLVAGTFVFTTEQSLQPYYLDGWSYSMAGAVAECMEQLAMDQNRAKSWSRGGVTYTYHDFQSMAKDWRKMAGTTKGRLI